MEELKNKKILIVDDEKDISEILKDALIKEGFYSVFTADSCKETLNIIKNQLIALCVLDVNLPDGSGFSLYNDIRKITQVPVVFLTARGEPDDKIQGFGLGADDYIVKPFLIKEFILRIEALLRRTYIKIESATGFRLPDRTVSFETASIKLSDKEIPLTAKELTLIKKLWENKNKIVTNDSLCMAAWGDEYYGYENTLMVHIRRIRKKIEKSPSNPKFLITVKGIGYKLVIDNE